MGDWIDDVARAMASGVSRRGALRGVGAGLAGMMLASLAPAKAAEAKKGKGKGGGGNGGGQTGTGGQSQTGTNDQTNGDQTNTDTGTDTNTDQNGGGNSTCSQWCQQNFSGSQAGRCTSDAAKGRGPCFECGPRAPGDNNKVPCGGKCVLRCGSGETLNRDTCLCETATCDPPRELCNNRCCRPANEQCSSNSQCCSGKCWNGRCRGYSVGSTCPCDAWCTSGRCVDGRCQCPQNQEACRGRCFEKCPNGQTRNPLTCQCNGSTTCPNNAPPCGDGANAVCCPVGTECRFVDGRRACRCAADDAQTCGTGANTFCCPTGTRCENGQCVAACARPGARCGQNSDCCSNHCDEAAGVCR